MKRRLAAYTALVVAAIGCTESPPPKTTNDVPSAPTAASSAAIAAVPVTRDGVRLPRNVLPTGYDIFLRVDPRSPRFSGTTTLAVKVVTPTAEVVLHGRDLTISHVVATVNGAAISGTASPQHAIGDSGPTEELRLTFDQVLPAGDASIAITYDAPLEDSLRGLYKVGTGASQAAFTQFEATDARRAFPCFDEPGFKAPMRLSVDAPKGMVVIANSPVESTTPSPDGAWNTFHFAVTPPLPTYLLAFGVGALGTKDGPKISAPLRLVAIAGREARGGIALDATARVIPALEDYFARPYPYAKLDIVAVPDFAAGAMENPGFVTFREELLLLDPSTASANDKRRMITVVAHELAHQWFGDLVTANWWDDIWLNEGFASWLETKIVDQLDPGLMQTEASILERLSVMDLDTLPSARAVRQSVKSASDAAEAFDGVTYTKGEAFLRMLEAYVGKDPFRDGVRAYIADHANGNATTNDFIGAIEKASGKELKAIASSFLDKPGVPRVAVEARCDGSPRLHFQQSVASLTPSAPTPRGWSIPVCYATGDGSARASACVLLDKPELDVPVSKCPTWVVANADERGYFRTAVTAATATQTTKTHGAELTNPEKLGLFADAWAETRSGALDAKSLLTILKSVTLTDEKHVVDAWATVAEALYEQVLSDSDRAKFSSFVRAALGPLAKKHGWDEKGGDPLLRALILENLGGIGNDPAVQREATARAKAYLDKKGTADADTAQLALRIAARRGDRALFDAIAKLATTTLDPSERTAAIRALGSFEDPALVTRALEMLRGGEIKAQDSRYLRVDFERRATQAAAFAWLQDHDAAIHDKLPDFIVGRFLAAVVDTCDAKARDERSRFVLERAAKIEGSERDAKLGLEHAAACGELRTRLAPALSKALPLRL